MLQILNLSKSYHKTLAVDNVSFTVPDGQVGILLGPNGAGKSTIIKSVAGLLRFDGAITIQGIPSRELAAKKIFGYVPEIPALFDALTVREHIEYIRRAYKSDISGDEIDSLLQRFELFDKQDKLGNELSKGMMQKVSICCALAVKPKVMMLDEPMVGLDPQAIRELKEIVLKLRREGVTVLISTHMLEMVNELWDVVFIVDQGHILASYTREEAGDKDLDAIFFDITGHQKESEGRQS
ncbi:MAG: ABC transporter ATP-binding protein [Lachnospiraceae bacterium]|jgi:ABC-type multidrug transport system ATPase subunit|nr:ABC transporter ATP-binding protein [Lachnospiraceae bacterium]